MAQRVSFALWISSRPWQGRRSRRPASTHRQIPAHFRLTLCRGRRPRRPVRFSSMSPTGSIPRPRARVTFGRSPKSDQKVCLKPQVSRLPARLGYVKNLSPCPPRSPKLLQIVVQRIAYDPLIAAAPTSRTVVRCSVAAQRRFLRCFVVFYIVCNASAGRSGAARGCICSFADVLKFADGPVLAPVGAGVLDGPFVFPPCHQQGEFRARGHGSLLAAAPKVTKNAA